MLSSGRLFHAAACRAQLALARLSRNEKHDNRCEKQAENKELTYSGVHWARAHKYRGWSAAAWQQLPHDHGTMIPVPGGKDSNSAVTGVAHGECRPAFTFPTLGRGVLR